MKRTIVIGDLHGVYDETLDLLDKVAATSNDRIIFLGDLVDRGSKPRECVELAMKHECVLGNHEEKHLHYWDDANLEMKGTHKYTWDRLSDRHLQYFDSLPLYIKLPEYNAVVLHAGVLPGIPIAKQDPRTLLHCQNICPPNKRSYWPSKSPAGYRFWTNYWKGPERIIFGHTVLDKPLVSEFAVGIDTGCVFGLSLTALILPDWEVVSVPARKVHHFSARRGSDPNHPQLATYEVMDGVKCFS